MASLELSIDGLDMTPAGVASNTKNKPSRTAPTWTKSIFGAKKTVGLNQVTGGTAYSQATIVSILNDFLQPNSKVLLNEATESILALIPANAPSSAEVFNFGATCVELAEQIPYHHPSQQKFVRLLGLISRSPKVTEVSHVLPKEELTHCYQLLGESIADGLNSPEADNPEAYVNLHAFIANLFDTGIWGSQPGYALMAMREAFEEKQPEETWERDCNAMAAAQWIIWYGQTLFKQILYYHFEDGGKPGTASWRFGKQHGGPADVCRSVGRWRFWKRCFEARGSVVDASDECKKLMSSAAELMGTIEKGMWFEA